MLFFLTCFFFIDILSLSLAQADLFLLSMQFEEMKIPLNDTSGYNLCFVFHFFQPSDVLVIGQIKDVDCVLLAR